MKGLEALNRLYGFCIGTNKYYKQFLSSKEPMEQDKNSIEKELKALEIIKKKEVDINSFGVYLSVGWDYNLFEKYCGDNSPYEEHPPYQHSITKDEFDLLKEVLE